MKRRVFTLFVIVLSVPLGIPVGLAAAPDRDRTYTVTPETIRAMEEAVPDVPLAEPQEPRRLLVYGRVPTHPESVACCFKAMEILGRKTGAFEAVSSGDPAMFLPETLSHFDAVVMNNTHERTPMLPFSHTADTGADVPRGRPCAAEPRSRQDGRSRIAHGRRLRTELDSYVWRGPRLLLRARARQDGLYESRCDEALSGRHPVCYR